MADGQINTINLEIRYTVRRDDVDIQFRMAGCQFRQARDKPFGSEGRRRADGQPHRLRAQVRRCAGDDFKGPPDIGNVGAPFPRQRQRARQALEQLQTKLGFQSAHLLGNRALRHAQFFRSQPEVQMACGGLKGFEAI